MTAESTPEHVVDSIRQRAYSYLSKPLSSGVVRETVFRALSKLSDPGEKAADFVIDGPAGHGLPGLVHLFGIESPGLTSALSIADQVVAQLEA